MGLTARVMHDEEGGERLVAYMVKPLLPYVACSIRQCAGRCLPHTANMQVRDQCISYY
jgi:hypothetical protein